MIVSYLRILTTDKYVFELTKEKQIHLERNETEGKRIKRKGREWNGIEWNGKEGN